MNIFNAFKNAWRHSDSNVPIVMAVRLLSFAIIAPLIALAIKVATSISGQSAITDQDIVRFIFSPLGFPTFLAVMGLVMMGNIIGTAMMTVSLRNSHLGRSATIISALSQITGRFGALMQFAILLVLRVLLVLLPAAACGTIAAWVLLSDYDINYYLTAWPSEFVIAIGVGGLLVVTTAGILLPRLLSWSVALHFVLFTAMSPRLAFSASQESMHGKRLNLLGDLLLWFAIRAVLLAVVGGLFVVVLGWLPQFFGDGLSALFVVTAGIAVLWGIANLVVAAVSLHALAQILLLRFEALDANITSAGASRASVVSLSTIGAGAAAILLLGTVGVAFLAPDMSSDEEVLIIAHRGASAIAPENTMAAINAAVEAKADWVEIDVQETADGVVVVMHDSDFMKLSSNELKIWDATMDRLADIDIGSWYDPTYSGERVPTLLDALEAVRDRSKLLIELKYYGHDIDLEKRTIEIVEGAGMADQVATMSLKVPAVEKMQTLRPDWDAGVLAATAFGDLTGLNADFVAVNANLATARLVEQVRKENKQLYVWTINDPFDMSAMISLGVDGLITDKPALAKEVLEFRSTLTAAERMFLVFLERCGLTSIARSEVDARI